MEKNEFHCDKCSRYNEIDECICSELEEYYIINNYIKSIWHPTVEVPTKPKDFLMEMNDGNYKVGFFDGDGFVDSENMQHINKETIKRYAYIEDLTYNT